MAQKVTKKSKNQAEQLEQPEVKSNHLEIQVKRLDKTAKIPTQEVRDIPDAGWDIFTNERKRIPGHGKYAIKTGIAFNIPKGWLGHIRPRSGVAVNTPLMIDAGVVDPGYRGEVKVVLVNTSEYPYDVEKGIKIAQMIFEQIPNVVITEVADLPQSDRDTKGFGSTGTK